MNRFVKAITDISESSVQNNGYVRNLIRMHGGEISHRASSKRG